MTKYSLAYGSSTLEIDIPEWCSTTKILPPITPACLDSKERIRLALTQPLDFFWPNPQDVKSIAIAINDKTRPVPHEVLLPELLQHLINMGFEVSAIHIWIATGTHKPMPKSEYELVVPRSLLGKYAILSHDIDSVNNMEYLGETSYRTPIWVNKLFYEADLKIVVGNIEPHHFAGFSGGMKTAAIGLGGRETIDHNHAMLNQPEACVGKYETNPLRQDIEEIGDKIGVHLALNVVLNQDHQIVDVFAGKPKSVFQVGIQKAKEICAVKSKTDFDMVIASAGGYPKDINFYQAQKALTHASLFARKGAPLILVAECKDGSGNIAYERIMEDLRSIEDVYRHFSTHPFCVGPHKALQMARILQRNPVIIVSSMTDELANRLLMTPFQNLQTAVDTTLSCLDSPLSIAILPQATTTIRA